MKEKEIKEIVYSYYEAGYHCAESIIRSIQELSSERYELKSSLASGFCGGIGKCKQDICGALSGGIITLGALYGREQGNQDISKVVFLSSELRRLFIEEFGTTKCQNVIENIQMKPYFESCRDVTVKTAQILYELIQNDLESLKEE